MRFVDVPFVELLRRVGICELYSGSGSPVPIEEPTMPPRSEAGQLLFVLYLYYLYLYYLYLVVVIIIIFIFGCSRGLWL